MARLLAILIGRAAWAFAAFVLYVLLFCAAMFGLPSGSTVQHGAIWTVLACFVLTMLAQCICLALELQTMLEKQP